MKLRFLHTVSMTLRWIERKTIIFSFRDEQVRLLVQRYALHSGTC